MEFKDYYAALGVAPDSDEKTIKQAYRKLARQHHPDVKPGDKEAEERFKEINEAYQALSDPERRKKYDALRKQYQQWSERGGRGDFDWGQWQTTPGGPGQGAYSYDVSPEDLEDLFGGGSPFSDFFGSIFGQAGGGPAGAGRAPRPRRGRDHEAGVEISLEEAFHGTTRGLQIGDRRIEARIPPGARSGSRVRLAGQGSPGVAGEARETSTSSSRSLPIPGSRAKATICERTCGCDFYTAALGGEVRVRTIDGAVTLKIPPHTQADKTFRLKGKGMPRLGRPAERGDMWARVRLVLPESMSDAEIEGLRTLAENRKK